jgi:hypothetical protein
VLSREELRTCIQCERDLNQRSDEIDNQERTRKANEAELDGLKQTIDRKRASVDRSNDKAVKDFNPL